MFVNAGNVWLREENESLPSGKFSSNFMNELGIGTGLCILLNLAAPLQKPFETKNGPTQLYTEDAILNFALGYPF